MEKTNLSLKVSVDVYRQLKSDIGRGKMSDFVEALIIKELGSTEKKMEQEYREFYANPQNLKEAKKWEKASIESWQNHEKNKNKKTK